MSDQQTDRVSVGEWAGAAMFVAAIGAAGWWWFGDTAGAGLAAIVLFGASLGQFAANKTR
jgi:hypothetical protein